ncbi:hypothetical protein [Giesbergeria anulus]|uniref:Uncharacterized protein n=1 Tax=Giesbergeria anulus TaxID=180197 RepID=A0A1H9NHA2_9BURK|nr:hypothetical protein [Giesbergeria anulus]SER35029.1 hypothetical protein SAMN02982919_02210 [Giesbergeria anulus]
MKFTVRKIFQYTEEVEVEADNSTQAKKLAESTDGEVNHDDTLIDCEIIGVE